MNLKTINIVSCVLGIFISNVQAQANAKNDALINKFHLKCTVIAGMSNILRVDKAFENPDGVAGGTLYGIDEGETFANGVSARVLAQALVNADKNVLSPFVNVAITNFADSQGEKLQTLLSIESTLEIPKGSTAVAPLASEAKIGDETFSIQCQLVEQKSKK